MSSLITLYIHFLVHYTETSYFHHVYNSLGKVKALVWKIYSPIKENYLIQISDLRTFQFLSFY